MAVNIIDPTENWIIHKRKSVVWIGRILALIVTVAALLIITHEVWLSGLSEYLTIGEPPIFADAIIVLSGGPGDRARHGAEVFLTGYAPVVLTAGEPHTPGTPAYDAEYEMGRLELFGIPADNIQTLGVLSSTIEEAERSRDWMETNGKRTLIVISDSFHLRRVSLIFNTVFQNANVDLVYVAAEPSWFRQEGWWLRDAEFDAIVSEYVKMANTLTQLGIRSLVR